jgi:hypothetical protein
MTITCGRCQCGAIAYEFDGEPKWVMHCHCANCRRAVSSAIATYIGVRTGNFRYIRGEPAAYDSSPGVKRYFCGTCGTPMGYTGERWPGARCICSTALWRTRRNGRRPGTPMCRSSCPGSRSTITCRATRSCARKVSSRSVRGRGTRIAIAAVAHEATRTSLTSREEFSRCEPSLS